MQTVEQESTVRGRRQPQRGRGVVGGRGARGSPEHAQFSQPTKRTPPPPPTPEGTPRVKLIDVPPHGIVGRGE